MPHWKHLRNSLFLTHSTDDSNKEVLPIFEISLDLLANVTLRKLDVVFRTPVRRHKVQVTVIYIDLRTIRQGWMCEMTTLGLTSWNSLRATLGTSILWVDGHMSSYSVLHSTRMLHLSRIRTYQFFSGKDL